MTPFDMSLGAVLSAEGTCSFLVWAPRAQHVEVHVVAPAERSVAMQSLERGYFGARIERVIPGSLYRYRLDKDRERPDPASRLQPQGVHGPSQIVSSLFDWDDHTWRGIPIHKYVLYELHVGTFTPAGTFAAAIPRIPKLKDLGITAIEIMPVAQFPGTRNWGYDGVYPFAVQNSYGGPTGLKEFVNACHRHQMATVLDVVYNHLGPEGNYLGEFGPYFTDIYKTPWGEAINFDGAQSDEVRRYFIDNALQWIGDFHIDALRLDAIHAIVDPSARPFVQQLRDECHQKALDLNRHIHVIAESNRNDRKVVSAPALGGWGLDAVWNDDFHHSLRVSLTGETDGYYEDFVGIEHMGQAFRDGFVYTGQYSKFRQRHYGNSSRDIPGERLVVFSQNHDQVGNRKLGDRLGAVASFEQLKLAAGTVLLSPYLPLLFMGEEYGETAPFLYFVDHGDPMLIEAVRKGRREEFASFQWTGDLPDPQGEGTFLRSKLDWTLREGGRHRLLWTFYQEVLRLRRSLPALAHLDKNTLEVSVFTDAKTVCAGRWAQENQVLLVLHFSQEKKQLTVPLVRGRWRKSLDSSERRWGGLRNNTQETWEGPGEVQLTLDPWSFQLLTASSENTPV